MSYLRKMMLPETLRVFRLNAPQGPVRAVLDTAVSMEADGSYALAYALLAGERLSLEAVYAAPCENACCLGPADGMEKSYEEIQRVLNAMGVKRDDFVFKGADCWLSDASGPVDSPATLDLIERAMSSDDPLYVLSIGAPTNIASAILMEPEIVKHIVVVWLGGQPHTWNTADEPNVRQDLQAASILLDCGVPLIQIPRLGVAELLQVSCPSLERCLEGKNALGDYLTGKVREAAPEHDCWATPVWAVAAVAWMVNDTWCDSQLVHAPRLSSDCHYAPDGSRHLMRVVTHLDRNAIFQDLLQRLNTVEKMSN